MSGTAPKPISTVAASLTATGLIVRREIASRMRSAWFFATATAACLIAWWYGVGFQSTFRTETIVVTDDPLKALNATIVTFLGFIIGLRLATSIAWEREHGTIQVLLSGPVTWLSIVTSKFLAELIVLIAFVVIYQIYLVAAQPLGAGVLSVGDTLSVAILVLFALPLLSLGLLVSAWSRTVRNAVLLYLVLVLLLAGFEVAHIGLSALSPTQASLTSLYLRAGLDAIEPALSPVSATAQLAHLFESVSRQSPVQASQTLAAVGLSLATFVLAYLAARLRGVS